MALRTPVVIVIYNRPHLARQVFEVVRLLKPSELFIVADGPKDKIDWKYCRETRKVFEHFDWPVKVHRNYLDKNVNSANRVITGLDWVFSQAEQAIILEDDCVPDISFFRFCEELLNYYEMDEHVMYIAGNNLGQIISTPYSYAFTHWAMYWGWATWARAWQKFNHDLNTWQLHTDKLMRFVNPSNQTLFSIISGEIHVDRSAWDVPWNTDVWLNDAVGIIPVKNLVNNIGFDSQSYNFTNPDSQFAKMVTEAMGFPLAHPKNKKATASINMEKAFFELIPESFPV